MSDDGPLVAHVIIVAFHAKLGNRIEFSYPRLRGEAVLRSPDLGDSLDISADPLSPSQSPRPYVTGLTPPAPGLPCPVPSPSAGGRRGDWGTLPEEWRFLPFMALPEGVHDLRHDVVFFKLEPAVHCVSCFRQAVSEGNLSQSACKRGGFEKSVAARGSVQKSVVLLCRRPLYGVLADRLAPAVRAYFEQADFARTDVLAALFHSLNHSLARPSLSNAPTLFHGLDLKSLVRRVGLHALVILKLILMEKRVVFYSQPVAHASNAVVAFASIFPGALDTIAPGMTPLDCDPTLNDFGFPLALFGARDRVVLQPYAPLPHIAELLHSSSPNDAGGCVIATSHNVGMLLSSAAAAASRDRSVSPPHRNAVTRSPPRRNAVPPHVEPSPLRSQSALLSTPPDRVRRASYDRRDELFNDSEASARLTQSAPRPPAGARSFPRLTIPPPSFAVSPPHKTGSNGTAPARKTGTAAAGGGRLPVVDALVNLSTGKVSVSGALEPLVRITKLEKRFMRDLVAAATTSSSASVSASGATGSFMGSDDHIRDRLRAYLCALLSSAAAVRGIAGGPPLSNELNARWRREDVQKWDLSTLTHYNERFAREWLTTRNAAMWARRFSPRIARMCPPPAPQLLPDSGVDEFGLPAALLPAADELVSGLRQNVAELGRLSSMFSTRAAQGISSFFKRVEAEVVRVENAVGASASYARVDGGEEPSHVALPPRPLSHMPPRFEAEALRLSKSDTSAAASKQERNDAAAPNKE